MHRYAGWLRFLVILLCSVLAIAICFVSTITVFAYQIAPAGTFMETLFVGIGLSIWATMRGKKRCLPVFSNERLQFGPSDFILASSSPLP